MTDAQRRILAAVCLIIGLLALAAGIIWLTTEAKSLPGFMGHISGSTVHRSKRGTAAVIVGGVLLLAAIGAYLYRPRPRQGELESAPPRDREARDREARDREARPRDPDAPPRDREARPRDPDAPPRDPDAPPRDPDAPPRDPDAPPRDPE